MRRLLIIALALAHAPLSAQGPWGTVKTWTGTVTIEATETTTGPGDLYHKMTYKATGSFTITDDMMPDEYHMQWPMLSAENPPADPEAAYKRWQAHVVGGTEGRYADERGTKVNRTCRGEKTEAMRLGLTIDPTKDNFVLQFQAPRVALTCTGGSSAQGSLRKESLQIIGQRGNPGTKTGTETITVDAMTIKVSYSFAPAR
jgi:hypothetical protein